MISDAMGKRARSFEVGAATYERVWPEFPEALFDDLVASAGVPTLVDIENDDHLAEHNRSHQGRSAVLPDEAAHPVDR